MINGAAKLCHIPEGSHHFYQPFVFLHPHNGQHSAADLKTTLKSTLV